VINDDQSWAHTGFAGCRFVDTPGFDRVAAGGVYFANCYASSPGSAPSRGALVTGRHHWQNRQSGQHASSWMNDVVPFVDLLRESGYHTGFTGKGVDPFRYARDGQDSLWRRENAAGKPFNVHRFESGSDSDPRPAGGIGPIDYFENFRSFLTGRNAGQPFYFWYGAAEPHRAYEQDSWRRNGKSLDKADLPDFLPDTEVTRGDLLDYAVEIDWADAQLVKMLDHLEATGELDNTIVIVTADNGMAFPRAKANCFEYGVHVPLAISFGAGFPGGRRVDDPVSFIDLAPTILEMAEVEPEGMLPMSGRSLAGILRSRREGTLDRSRRLVFSGRERHSSSRWNNLGYPQRAVRGGDHLLIWNVRPERWPAGDPQAVDEKTGKLLPLYGLGDDGLHISDQAFTDVDGSPSKSLLVERHAEPAIHTYFELAFAKRAEFELYNVVRDPGCLNNLSGRGDLAAVESELKQALFDELERTGDPRAVGPDPDIFESYIRYDRMRNFPDPNNQ
jgi:uncharacterized sulfatase